MNGPPYDFSPDREDRVDPVEFLAIRADDEVLDGLAAGHPLGVAVDLGSGYSDDQQVLALLARLRTEIDSADFPQLVTVDEAVEAIAAGRAATRPRRLVPVAAAAALVVLALGGIAIGAGQARPGDPLWGVSAAMNGDRAHSIEAAYRVDTALSDARTALAQGRVADAQATLRGVAPELNQVKDPAQRDELTQTSRNLIETAGQSSEGERVDTDPSGRPSDPDRARRHGTSNGSNGAGANGSNGRPGESSSARAPEGSTPGSAGSPASADSRRQVAPERSGPKPDNPAAGSGSPEGPAGPKPANPRGSNPGGDNPDASNPDGSSPGGSTPDGANPGSDPGKPGDTGGPTDPAGGGSGPGKPPGAGHHESPPPQRGAGKDRGRETAKAPPPNRADCPPDAKPGDC